MARFRMQKTFFSGICFASDWKKQLEAYFSSKADAPDGGKADSKEAIGPLLALLPRMEMRWQAAYGLGLAVAALEKQPEGMEAARIIMRRLMWSLNEESGNLGWGIPEAMGCILGQSPRLADEYARIFISYGYETGKDDNFLDHAPLRQGVYWGIGELARSNPAAALPALPHLDAALASALQTQDASMAAMAAYALTRLAEGVATPAAQKGDCERQTLWQTAQHSLQSALSAEGEESGRLLREEVELFDGSAIIVVLVEDIFKQALPAIERIVKVA